MRARHYFSLAAVAALTCGLGGNLPMGAAFAEDGLSPPSRITAVYRVDLGSFNLGDFKLTMTFRGEDYQMRGEGRFTVLAGLIYEWRGVTASSGRVTSMGPEPAMYAFNYSDSAKAFERLRMTFDGRTVSGVSIVPRRRPLPRTIPVTQEQLEGVIDPDWPTLKKDEFRVHWKQGKCGMMQENFAALSTKSNYADFDANFPNGSWVSMDPPKGPDGASSAGVITQPARIYAVSQRAMDEGKGPAIAKLLEWMATDGYMLLAFGQEGVNYKLDDKGYVITDGIEDAAKWTSKESQPLTQLANMVYIFSDVELQARYPSYTAASGREMDPLAYYAAFQKQAYTNSSAAAIINPPANAADFLRFYSENIVQFVLGQKPLTEESWAEYIAGLDSLGAKDLEANALQTLKDASFLE